MAKSPRNEDPRAERDESQQRSGTYVEVVGTPRRRKRGTPSSAPKEAARDEGVRPSEGLRADAPAKRESVRPSAIPAEQIRLPSGAVAYVSPALPRSSRNHEAPRADRGPAAAELHLDAPSWVDSGPTDRVYPPPAAPFKVPRAIREVIPRRIEDEREEFERASRPPASEARQSTVHSVRSESTRPRASLEAARQSSIPSESTRPRAIIDCIPDETTQARARLSAVQASLVLASKSDRPPAMTRSVPPSAPPPSGASVLDAKPQMVSDAPAPKKTSWAVVGAVAVLCSIISAAGVVAFKESQSDTALSPNDVQRAAVQPVTAAPVAQAKHAPVAAPTPTALGAPSAPSVAPMPSVEQLPSEARLGEVAAPAVPAPAIEAATAAVQAAPTNEPQVTPALSAPLSPAPTAAVPSPRRASGATHVDAPPAFARTQPAQAEVVALPTALTPGDTKAVLTELAAQERATAVAEERKREEERKLPSTARLKAPSVRIEAGRIAAALKKASQEAVARVNEEQAPAAPAPAPKAESADALPENPF